MVCLPEHVRTHVSFNGTRDELLTALDKASPGTSYGGCDERTIVSPLNKTEAVETKFSRARAGAGSNGDEF